LGQSDKPSVCDRLTVKGDAGRSRESKTRPPGSRERNAKEGRPRKTKGEKGSQRLVGA